MNRIADFKSLHQGKNLFVLASGPSLAELDLAPLRRRIVMGLNRSFLLYPETHYHCAMDERLFDAYPQELRAQRILFTLAGRPFGIGLPLLGSDGFSFDLEQGIYSGWTIAYFGLQIAVYMGFRKVFYLGLDLKNRGSITHFFGPDFHSAQHEQTEYPRMRRMFCHAANLLAARDVAIYNCSAESTLECFPKVSYEWAIGQ